ncbi:hypothetical protein [Brevundimonas viscosa]|uniref:Pentapeptide repeat-containing protein n=1 Tax=Brevundimonas viscosa TaxID=871741 RepID=A0A1I6NTG0_9CAUL|nr:hypothetical protein [Brevundimonas viscosa]SFS31221.1 hypothetical protein SAMN05192570_0485 [Brevundimonas viscosa]
MTDPRAAPTETRQLDPLAKDITGGRFTLFDLYRASVTSGGGAVIEGRTFTDCTIEGPALMLVLEGTHFEGVNFGPTGGDMRGMLFRSLNGKTAIGAIPVRDCTFRNCQFFSLGITGADQLLNALVEQVRTVD